MQTFGRTLVSDEPLSILELCDWSNKPQITLYPVRSISTSGASQVRRAVMFELLMRNVYCSRRGSAGSRVTKDNYEAAVAKQQFKIFFMQDS